jgi:hypothetical protein
VAVYYSIGQGVPQITQTQSVYLQSNQTSYFSIFGYLVAIKLVSSSNYGATLYVSRVPILMGPVSTVFLNAGSSASMSSAGSQTADMNVKLLSSSSSGASLAITPLPASLSISTSSTVTVLSPAPLVAGSASMSSNANPNSITSYNTITTSISVTTTVQNAAATQQQQALSIANGSSTGALMRKYKALYNSDTSCSASAYSATYALYYGIAPSAPNDYANVSAMTPTDITVNASLISGSQYKVTYSTVSRSSLSTGPVAIITVDTSSRLVVSTTFAGIFRGLSYATINSTYAFQNGVLNKACGAFISPH